MSRLGLVSAKAIGPVTVPIQSALKLEVLDWGFLGYKKAYQRQLALVEQRIAGDCTDRLVLVEHPAVATLGRSGDTEDLCISQEVLRRKGVEIYSVDRGGRATFHGRGQLVAYPIIKLVRKDLHRYLQTLLEVVAAVVRTYGLEPVFKTGQPGVWVNGGKIASVGIAVKKWVTYHGVALNVNVDLEPFNWIVPCGHRDETMISLKSILGKSIDLNETKKIFIQRFRESFAYRAQTNEVGKIIRHPDWLRRPAPGTAAIVQMENLLDRQHLATVCQSAQCPNLGECFKRGTATFMILGTCCTRACRFCAVDKGRPEAVDPEEPERIARTAQLLGLTYVVITSVTRDDLPDGGAEQFVRVIIGARARCRDAAIEVLIPDFKGSVAALQKVCDVRPDMLNHNIETVPRLYPLIRPGAQYRRSIGILEYAARQGLAVKSGLMLGLGETENEVLQTLFDLKRTGCRYLTLGQYLAPSADHVPVARFITPEEFNRWAATARRMGFSGVAAGPLVRSSYHADEMFQNRMLEENNQKRRETV